MTFISEPTLSQAPRGQKQRRWRWWYAGIADYRLAHPGCSNDEVAKHLNKHPNTISIITNSDLYREYEAQRKAQWREKNEDQLREKLTGVTIKVLDAIDEKLSKQKDQIPMPLAVDLLKSGLDRLGFAPSVGPAVVINNNQQNNNVQLPPSVTPSVLEEARMALRAVERQRMRPLAPPMVEVGPGSTVSHSQHDSQHGLEANEEVLGGPTSTDS